MRFLKLNCRLSDEDERNDVTAMEKAIEMLRRDIEN
jgi:hypothetical protein